MNVDIVAKNIGTTAWRPSGATAGSVNLALITRNRSGEWDYEFRRYHPTSGRVQPGEEFCFSLAIPKSEIEGLELYADLVAEHVTWFSQNGAAPLRLT